MGEDAATAPAAAAAAAVAAAPMPAALSAPLLDGTTATATAASTSPSRSGRDPTQRPAMQKPSKKRRVDSAHLRRARGLLPPPTNVVLPPGHGGFNGEQLTTAQLAQLVTSVQQDGAAAQASAQQEQTAGDVAATELYRLQRAVAQMLLENVQLEKDIATLAANGSGTGAAAATATATATSTAGAMYGDTAGTLVLSLKSGKAPRAAAAVESRRRPLLLPPAPMPLPHVTAALTASALLVGRSATDRKGKLGLAALAAASSGRARDADAVVVVAQRPWQQQVAALSRNVGTTATTSRKTAPRVHAPTAAAAARMPSEAVAAAAAVDPATVLQELRNAANEREEERTRVLAEIDALASRVERHDTLLSAAAEYWRRNAAVMKRQQYAVQSQPKNSTPTTATTSVAVTRAMLSPADGSPLWEDGLPGVSGHGGHAAHAGALTASVPYLMQAATAAAAAASSESEEGSGASSPIDRGSPSATLSVVMSLSGRMTMLDGSPSQLQRALAQMEAVSPNPPSSSLSLDLRPNRALASASGLCSSPEVMGHLVRRQILLPARAKTTTASSNATEVRSSSIPTSTTLRKSAGAPPPPAAATEWTLSDGTSVTTATTTGATSAATAHRQPHRHPAPSAATTTTTTAAANASAALLYSRGGRRIDVSAVGPAGGRAGVRSAATETATETTIESDMGAVVRSDAELPSDSLKTSPGNLSASAPNFAAADAHADAAARDRGVGRLDATSCATRTAAAEGRHRAHAASPYSVEDTSVTVAGSPDLHTSRTSTATVSRRYASGSSRREDEDVLARGTWRTIPALQLDNLDEIAEFIYSVFEQA